AWPCGYLRKWQARGLPTGQAGRASCVSEFVDRHGFVGETGKRPHPFPAAAAGRGDFILDYRNVIPVRQGHEAALMEPAPGRLGLGARSAPRPVRDDKGEAEGRAAPTRWLACLPPCFLDTAPPFC